MADLATLQTRLDEVDTAIHALMTGNREVQVRSGDSWVSYSETDLTKLESYRASLARQIATLTGTGKRVPIYLGA